MRTKTWPTTMRGISRLGLLLTLVGACTGTSELAEPTETELQLGPRSAKIEISGAIDQRLLNRQALVLSRQITNRCQLRVPAHRDHRNRGIVITETGAS